MVGDGKRQKMRRRVRAMSEHHQAEAARDQAVDPPAKLHCARGGRLPPHLLHNCGGRSSRRTISDASLSRTCTLRKCLSEGLRTKSESISRTVAILCCSSIPSPIPSGDSRALKERNAQLKSVRLFLRRPQGGNRRRWRGYGRVSAREGFTILPYLIDFSRYNCNFWPYSRLRTVADAHRKRGSNWGQAVPNGRLICQKNAYKF